MEVETDKAATRYICNQEDHEGLVCQRAALGFAGPERDKVDELPMRDSGLKVGHNWVPLELAAPVLIAPPEPDKMPWPELKPADEMTSDDDPVEEFPEPERISRPPAYALGAEVLIKARVTYVDRDGYGYHLSIPTFGSNVERSFREDQIVGLAPRTLPPEPARTKVLIDKDNKLWLWRDSEGISGWVTEGAFDTYRTWVPDFVERCGPFTVLTKEGMVG